ncbi:voltage-gated potassium channel [Halomicrobium zhouii]|uniref:Voltage-gated potassium channel n=1 Tax=Halomicrobium zhouii TaxID=767519 RepID=A0A1I6KPR4_9EURY|nr:NAD-binding protein [Halomicrobium zhouii]SFR93223.1 voltage-gated potassium channel [Halomicrobium zhouii]
MDRVREWFGVRATLLLPTLVAILSFVTGVANISAPVDARPLDPYLPEAVAQTVAQTVGFTGTLTGFLLLVSAYGLRRRLRVAWYATLLFLPMSAVQGLLQGSVTVPGFGPVPVSAPLIALSLLSIPTVLINRRLFDRELELSAAQQASIAALLGAQVYITAGAYALRDDFSNLSTLTDALYFAIVTSSTVGYGDMAPVDGAQSARLFTLSAIVVGTASFALALGSVLGPAIQDRITRALGTMTDTQLDLLEDHVLVLGYGDLTEPILEELTDVVEYVVVTPDSATAATLQQRDVAVLTADPSDEEPQLRAGIERARAVVTATNDDAQDALSILTARELNPEVRIVAAATDRENVRKLKRAGADSVISPAVLGGHLLAESALGEDDSEEVADRIVDDEV